MIRPQACEFKETPFKNISCSFLIYSIRQSVLLVQQNSLVHFGVKLNFVYFNELEIMWAYILIFVQLSSVISLNYVLVQLSVYLESQTTYYWHVLLMLKHSTLKYKYISRGVLDRKCLVGLFFIKITKLQLFVYYFDTTLSVEDKNLCWPVLRTDKISKSDHIVRF